jgi:uncharacterized YccA/Bax inhibitor family protein
MARGNPVLSEKVFQRAGERVDAGTMTINGAIQKTLLLLLIAAVTGLFTWNRYFSGDDITAFVYGGAILGLVVVIVAAFAPRFAPILGPVYAALEGLVVGGISAIYQDAYAGLPAQAVGLTLGVLLIMLTLYATRTIRVTNKLRIGVIAATGAVVLVYLVSIVMSLFGAQVPYIHDSGPVGIIFSLVVVGIAAFNLLLDFDFIERGSQAGAPKFMEWYAALGLLVTLIWLYLEILRLLGKARE